jgi:hypothetical protein
MLLLLLLLLLSSMRLQPGVCGLFRDLRFTLLWRKPCALVVIHQQRSTGEHVVEHVVLFTENLRQCIVETAASARVVNTRTSCMTLSMSAFL